MAFHQLFRKKGMRILSAFILLTFFSGFVSAKTLLGTIYDPANSVSTLTKTFGQGGSELSKTELSSIIQKCLDADDLQKYYPTNSDKSLKQINIVQYPLTLASDLDISKGGKGINFIDGSKMPQMEDSYFSFRRILNTETTATVIGNYYYNHSSDGFKILSVVIEFEKSGSEWTIKSTTLGGDKL